VIRVAAGAAVGLLPPVLGVVSWLHGAAGGAGTGGRPFVIFLLVCLVAVFVLDEWSDGAR
jgi:hypothetical protein